MEFDTIIKQAFGCDLNKVSIAKSSLSPNDTDGEIQVMKKRTLHEELCELLPKNSFILAEK
ncbi:hypothetical protein LguiA_025228 [Lonicera macranthoides]